MGLAGLVAALGCTQAQPQPRVEQQLTQQPQQISCPAHEVPVPEYNSNNAVAYFRRLASKEGINQINISTLIYYLFYNSKSKNEEPRILTSIEEVLPFLILKDYNIVELYEMNQLHLPHRDFSARIYISGGLTYVMFDLEGPQNLPDGEPERVKCYNSWSPDFIRKAGMEILEERISDMENNSLPEPQKMPQGKAA